MIVTALSLLSSLALAAEPQAAPAPGASIEMPAFGVTVVFTGECVPSVAAGHVSAAKAGAFAIDLAKAQSICSESRARVAEQARRDAIATTIAPAQAQLIKDAGMAVVIGRNVRVVTPDVTVESGSHLDWQAYGEAVTTADPRLAYSGSIDPNLVGLGRLAGVPMGYPVTPSMPGQQITAPAAEATAACGTAAECQATIDEQARAMAASDE